MTLRRTLRTSLLATTLALSLGAAARADEPAPNINNLPTTCPEIAPREINRHVVDAQENLFLYTTKLGGSPKRLVVVETNDPAVTVGQPYRVPIGRKDLIEIDTEADSLLYRNSISFSSTSPELVNVGADHRIWSEDLPDGFTEGTFNYWTQARKWDSRRHRETACASVAFPISLYSVEDSAPKVPPAQGPDGKRLEVSITEMGAHACVPKSRCPQCSDGKDNDGDGAIDFPDDKGCDSPHDRKERSGNEREPAQAKSEINFLLRKGVDQYTFRDSRGSNYDPLQFDINALGIRYRRMGERTKLDLQGVVTQGDDGAGLRLSAFDVEAHVDAKLSRSKVSPGLSAAVGYKDVRTYWDFLPGMALEDSHQANGYGYLGVNLAFTGDSGFASGDFLVLRAGVVAQPIIDKQVAFNGRSYDATTDMELTKEISADARWSFTERTWLDIQARVGLDVTTAYTSPSTGRDLERASDYKNLTLGLGHLFGEEARHGIYGQLKWADNGESWNGLSDSLGRPYDGSGMHEGLAVGAGYTIRW